MVPRGAIDLIAARTLSLIAAAPVSTTMTPSLPADTVILPPAPTSLVRSAELVVLVRILRRQQALAGQVVRNRTMFHDAFGRLLARVRREHETGIERPDQGRADVGLRHVRRVVDDDGRAKIVVIEPLVSHAYR